MDEQGEEQSDSDKDEHDPSSEIDDNLYNAHVANENYYPVDSESTSLEPFTHFDFSADAEEELYYNRLEEGYNLADKTYDAWLDTHHFDLKRSMSSPSCNSDQLTFSARGRSSLCSKV